jgi:polysaccharide export outer membrane protein
MIGKSGFLTALVGAALLAACASGPPRLAPGPHLTVLPMTELPPPAGVDPRSGVRVYRVGPFDKLAINVFGVPDLSQTIQVDAGGRIAFPLAGAIDVSGKTPDEISREIAQRLSNYVRNPQVSVNLEETVSQVVTVDGQVAEPGLYPVVGRMTLLRAIATAKGVTEFARLQDVVIFRTVGDRQLAALFNLAAIRRGTYPDPEVFASDVIVVGDSPSRRLFRDFLQASPLVITPIIALLQSQL